MRQHVTALNTAPKQYSDPPDNCLVIYPRLSIQSPVSSHRHCCSKLAFNLGESTATISLITHPHFPPLLRSSLHASRLSLSLSLLPTSTDQSYDTTNGKLPTGCRWPTRKSAIPTLCNLPVFSVANHGARRGVSRGVRGAGMLSLVGA